MKKTVTREIIFVDFKNKKVLNREVKTEKIKGYNFSNFNLVPEDSNFAAFSDQERMEYSDHCLAHIHDASFEDLVHWANMGMIDLKKVNEVLDLDRPTRAKAQKRNRKKKESI